MKKILLASCLAVFVFSCKQKLKTTIEKFTDTAVRDSVIKISYADSVKADSLKKVFQAALSDTIIPGKSIGNIKLNTTSPDIIKLLGPPDAIDFVNTSLLKWFSKPTGKGIDTTVNTIILFTGNSPAAREGGKVKHIRITSPYYKTAEQISCGSTITFIKLQYPSLKKASASFTEKQSGGQILVFDAVKEGIAFEINEATKCIGITVHLPGQRATETYFSIYGQETKKKRNAD